MKIKIYTLPEKTIDMLVKEYTDYVTNPANSNRLPPHYYHPDYDAYIPPEERALSYDHTYKAITGNDMLTPVKVWNLPKPQPNKIRAHFISLLHMLYMRYIGSETGFFRLSAEILQDIYPNYKYMLDVLRFTTILPRNTIPGDGFARTVYTLNYPQDFHFKEISNKIVESDLNKLGEIFTEIHKRNIGEAIAKTSLTFIDRYNKNVRKLQIVHDEALSEFMQNNQFKTEHSKLYYQHNIYKLKSRKIKEIEQCDDNGRIHHIGTQYPRKLRPYTNIQYIIDCKNSHLLLLNTLILQYYLDRDSISIRTRFNNKLYYNNLHLLIFNFLNKNNSIKYNHYFINNLCKELKNNNIDDSVCAKLRNIPQDVWEYMYRTMNGRLWDDFVSLLIDEGTIQAIGYQEARNQMKKVLFRKVFYTYAKNVKKDNEYGKAFKELYPNIMKIIRHYKRTFHAQCVEAGEVKKKMVNGEERGKDKIQLPHILMRLESAIFTDILTRLFKKRDLHCIGIHDAIAVMNDRYTPDFVQNIMKEVYAEYGLIPTLDIQQLIFD